MVAPLPTVTGGHQLSVGTDKHIVTDNGLKFIRTIVVAGNGSRADVNVIANFRIARKSDDQLSSLYPDALFFHLNEVTDVCTFQQLSTGTQTGKRANGTGRCQIRIFHNGIRTDFAIIANHAVF